MVNNTDGSIVGYKYFNFTATNGKKDVQLLLTLIPEGIDGTIEVIADRPWVSQGGRPLGKIELKADMPAGTPASDRERDAPGTADDYLTEYFCMKGIVLKDIGILSKMERELAGVYIPAAASGEGTLTKESSVFTPQQLKNLRRHAESVVRACAEQYKNKE